jgi:hypothetical protein
MPASSIGSIDSWGVYLAAAGALLLVLSPSLTSAATDSREGVDYRTLDGVRAILNALGPGEVTRFSFGSDPAGDPIRLLGEQLSCSYGRGTIIMSSALQLPTITLYPLVSYLAYINGSHVTVVWAV